MPFSSTFQDLELLTIKFQDFPGSVQTLVIIEVITLCLLVQDR